MAANGTFKPLKSEVSSALVDLTRTAGKIAAEDLAFQRSSNPAITPLLDKQNRRLLHLVRGLSQASTAGTDVQPPELSDVDSLEDKWNGLVDVFDSLLEKADACLDEYTGVIRRKGSPNGPNDTPTARKPFPPRSYREQTLPKPQLLFDKAPQNHEITPFKPILRAKPHAIQSLEASLRLDTAEDGRQQYVHPYQVEIEASRYPDFVHHNDIPIPFLPFESTAATYVDTPEAVAAMLEELKSAKEIAVDLEHHDTHSYLGLTSLMQISTRYKDWVVDTLKPWREDLQILNEVFADPSILKVFHGAFMDMIWLQRDLGLYVVGLFDTFHASKALGYPKNSLAALLARHANFNAAKQYQTADWRIRPLPEEMFNYARSDTHFLLYVYDILRNELLERSEPSTDGDLIDTVFIKSKEEALQRYERPFYDAHGGTGSTGWYNLLHYTPALFDSQQFAVFRAVHQWRDKIARQEDESLNMIMPKHVIYNIARETPIQLAALLGCAQPISTFVRSRAGELLGIIKQAKVDGMTGPEMMQVMRDMDSTTAKMTEVAAPVSTAAPVMVAANYVNPIPLTKDRPSPGMDLSTFWGPIIRRKFSDNSYGHYPLNADGIRLTLPIPQLTAEVFEDLTGKSNVGLDDLETNPGARAEHAYVKERKPKDEDVFIVRQVSGPKKRKAADLEDHADSPEPVLLGERGPRLVTGSLGDDEKQEISLNEVDGDQMTGEKAGRKTERRAQRRKAKKRRKLEEQQAAQENGMEDDAAFDYENAPSVLHAKKEAAQARPGAKEAFNPYSKSLDAPKSMRRARKEGPGKSLTFKS